MHSARDEFRVTATLSCKAQRRLLECATARSAHLLCMLVFMNKTGYLSRILAAVAIACFCLVGNAVGATGAASAAEPSTPAADKDWLQRAQTNTVLLFPAGTKPCENPADSLRFLGTGFLLTVPEAGGARSVPYLITNKHVLSNQASVIARVSTSRGCKCSEITLKSDGAEPTLYFPKKASINLAAIKIPAIPDSTPFALDYASLSDPEALRGEGVAEGHHLVSLDMFLPGDGSLENLSIVRAGSLSMLRFDEWTFSEYGPGQTYVAQLGTTFGATGMPVFLSGGRQMLGITKAVAFSPAPASVSVNEVRIEDGISVPKQVMAKGTAIIPNGLVMIEPAQNLKELLQSIGK